MRTVETTLEIKSWNEQPYRELPDTTKYTRAEVSLLGGALPEGGELGEGHFEALMYYRADGTSTYVVLLTIVATLDDRHGTLVLSGEGSFDGTSARFDTRVIDATEDLVGLTGMVSSVSTHADYPNMPLTLKYILA